MITLYGISNCDSVRKARRWLDGQGIAYRFHDYRKDGLAADLLQGWIDELGWEALLNRRGTTWRQLPESERAELTPAKAHGLMLAHPALIKRPLLDLGEQRKLGFNETDYAGWLASA